MTTVHDRPIPRRAAIDEADPPARPRDLTAADYALLSSGDADGDHGAAPGAPTMQPPGSGGRLVAAGAITGQQITVLWANSQDRNAHIHLQSAGWRKLGTATPSGFANLVALAGAARAAGKAPHCVEDTGGVVTGMYVW